MLFHEPTKTVFDWIRQQPHVKEESITDWLLFELSKSCNRLKYYAFSRHEETSNGADWEWWILTVHNAYRFRVQAKKLKPKADNYPSVCYSNKVGMQIDIIRNAAKSDGAFPLYMFYSAEEQKYDLVIQNYPRQNMRDMIAWCKTCDSGAFLSPADLVYDVVLGQPRRKIEASALLNISLKLSCFDSMLQPGNAHSINAIVENDLNDLDKLYKREKSKNYHFKYEYESIENSYQYNRVPSWLSYISGERQSNTELSEWFEGEFRSHIPKVAGIAVLDMRNE